MTQTMKTTKGFKLSFKVDNPNYPRHYQIVLELIGKDTTRKTHILSSQYCDIEGIFDHCLSDLYLELDKMDTELTEIDWKERNKGAGIPHLDVPVPDWYHERNAYIRAENAARIAKETAERNARSGVKSG